MEPGCVRGRKSEPGDRLCAAVPEPCTRNVPAEPEVQEIHGLAQLFTGNPPGQGDVRRPVPGKGERNGAADLPVQAPVHFAERVLSTTDRARTYLSRPAAKTCTPEKTASIGSAPSNA